MSVTNNLMDNVTSRRKQIYNASIDEKRIRNELCLEPEEKKVKERLNCFKDKRVVSKRQRKEFNRLFCDILVITQ